MSREIRLLDVAALLYDILEAHLLRGQVGTVVEELAPRVYEVELCDDDGRTYASASAPAPHLLPLVYEATNTAG